MSEQHTKGRIWLNAEQSAIVHSDDGRIACPPNHSQRWAWPENSRRLVACWNACEGVDTEILEKYPAPFTELREQRDELLEALKRITELDCPITGYPHSDQPTHEQQVEFWEYEKTQGRGEADDRLFALAAIAKAEGGGP